MLIEKKENKLLIKNRYRPEIDGLRGFAVLTVIVNHFDKGLLPGGYLGVDIFFVISGFVITSSLYQRPSLNFKDFLSGFYERRIKRLIPALLVFVFVMSIAICLFNPSPQLSIRTGLSSLFGLSNLYLFKQSTDYFSQSTELNVFTHTWSLGVEEQFYLLFPFLIWVSGFGQRSKDGLRNLFFLVGALTIFSLIGFLYLYSINQSAAYFLMPTRFWEISLGCLMFVVLQSRVSIEKNLEKLPSLLLLTLVIVVMKLPVSVGLYSTIFVVLLSMLLIASLSKKTKAYKYFTNPKVVYIGRISYSLYLWHWGVLSISRWTIGIHWWSVPFQVAFMFGLAIFSYKYIETPLRKNIWFDKRWKTLLFSGGAAITLSGFLYVLENPLKDKLFAGNTLNSFGKRFPRGDECLKNISKRTRCYSVNNKSNKTLWILGDSHVKPLYLAAEQVANANRMNLQLYESNGTPFPPVGHYRKSHKKKDLESLDNFRVIEKELYRQLQSGDIIFLSMRLPYHFGGTYYEYPSTDFRFINKDGSFGSQENYFDEWIDSVLNLANIAEKQGAKVVIQTPTPEWEREKNKQCSKVNKQWFNSMQLRNCQIKSKKFIDKKTGLYKHLFRKLNQLSSFHKNIYLFNTYQIVCPGKICSFTMDGNDIYQSDDHISIEWAEEVLASKIDIFIKSITD